MNTAKGTFSAVAYVTTEDDGEILVILTDETSYEEATAAIDKFRDYMHAPESLLKISHTILVPGAKATDVLKWVRMPKDMLISPYALEVWNANADGCLDDAGQDVVQNIIMAYLGKDMEWEEMEPYLDAYMITPLCRLPHALRIILAPIFDLYMSL